MTVLAIRRGITRAAQKQAHISSDCVRNAARQKDADTSLLRFCCARTKENICVVVLSALDNHNLL